MDDDPSGYASLDLSLAWILQQKPAGDGAPPQPKPALGKRNLFLLVCREALRDGQVDANDNEILQRVQKLLLVPGSEATKMFGVAKKELMAGKLPPAHGPLTPRKLFLKACRLAWTHGDPDEREAEILVSLAEALEIDAETRERMLGKLAHVPSGGELHETALFEPPPTTRQAEVTPLPPAAEGAPGPTAEQPAAGPEEEKTRIPGSESSLGGSLLAVPLRDKDTIKQWGSKARSRGKAPEVPGPPKPRMVAASGPDDKTKLLLAVLAVLLVVLWLFAGGE